ncbi:MAG TPA: hypothetical protein VHQ47_06200 [Phycisphaerae bacterium]|nr:hypothetical protein [Phycisphaerae bacterium]
MELATILDPANILSRPPRNAEGYKTLSSWGEEQIWGHRLWHRQTPWLLFLEFLGIAEAMLRADRLFVSDTARSIITYRLHQRIALRNLLFNNALLSRINESPGADSVKWDAWTKWMNEECEPHRGLDFGYLRQRFAKFGDFARTIELLRKTVLEPGTNRRWSSRFLFPFGQHALYEDLDITGAKAERQAINFGRAGDLLYMMLSRSSYTTELRALFADLLRLPNIPDKMVAKLLPPAGSEDLSGERTGGYLPYKSHPAYDRLAKDWLSLLRLSLPSRDAYAHVVPLAALHLLLYQMETAAAWCGRPAAPVYVCEIIAPKMEFVRQRALRSYLDNDGLPRLALEALARITMNGTAWDATANNPSLITDAERVTEAVHYLEDVLWLDPKEAAGAADLQEFKSLVLRRLHDKLDDNNGLLHSAYGRHCGLISKRGARSYRYAPTDALLKTLVLANVKDRIEFTEFLSLLFRRYRLVFGPVEASIALPVEEFEETPFRKNIDRLEERFRSMGLLNRLSDGVAYVENPFSGGL